MKSKIREVRWREEIGKQGSHYSHSVLNEPNIIVINELKEFLFEKCEATTESIEDNNKRFPLLLLFWLTHKKFLRKHDKLNKKKRKIVKLNQ